MKNIKAWVDDEIKAAFCAVATQQGRSESQLLLLIVRAFLKNNSIDSEWIPPTETKNEQFSFRLSAKLKRDLLFRAKQQGMSSGSYLIAMARAHLAQQPFFTELELEALNRTTNQLVAIGRNINQIARALNTSLDNAHMARAGEIEQVGDLVKDCRNQVRELMRANVAGWGIVRRKENY